MSQLYAERLKLAEPDEHIILPDAISKEPLGPAVRMDDPQWSTLVKWVYFGLLNAEELGIASDTVDAAMASTEARGPPPGRGGGEVRRGDGA